jgi:hypothetical protein
MLLKTAIICSGHSRTITVTLPTLTSPLSQISADPSQVVTEQGLPEGDVLPPEYIVLYVLTIKDLIQKVFHTVVR